jgi:hypothetical protein
LDSNCCLDGGASHHIATKQFYDSHPTWFTDIPPTHSLMKENGRHLPTTVQGLFGTDNVYKYVTFHPPWPAWDALVVSPMLITQHGATMLISERALVASNGCTVIHSTNGKWIQLATGRKIDLIARGGVHWLPCVTVDDSESVTRHRDTSCDTVLANVSLTDSFYRHYYSWFESKCPSASASMINHMAATTTDDTYTSMVFAATRKLSKSFQWVAAVLGFRNARQVDQYARSENVTLTDRDQHYMESALKARGSLKPDPSKLRQARKPRELWAQDPVTYKRPLFGGVTTVFFTTDAGTGRVRVFPCKSKNTVNALRAIADYGRLSKAWVNQTHDGPHIFQTDDDAIYKSELFRDFLRDESIVDRRSAPYCHRQNSLIEKEIGIIHGSALSMIHAVTWADSTREPMDFLHYALEHAAYIDSMLSPRGDDTEPCPYVKEYTATHAKDTASINADFSRITHPWGSRVFVVLGRTSQLSARGKYGYFVGVSEHHRSASNIYIPSTDRVITSQNVYFNTSSEFQFIPNLADNDLYETTLDELSTTPGPPSTSTLNFPEGDDSSAPPLRLTTSDTRIASDLKSDSVGDDSLTQGSADAPTSVGDESHTEHSGLPIFDVTESTLTTDESVYTAEAAVRDGHPINTTVNDEGELVIGIQLNSNAQGKAVFSDTVDPLFPTWDVCRMEARGFNTCDTPSEWGSHDWLYDDLTLSEQTLIDDTPPPVPTHWEDAFDKFDETTALSYILNEPHDLCIRHDDGTISDLHVVRHEDRGDDVVVDARAYASMTPDTPQSLTAALRCPNKRDRDGYKAAADIEMNGHDTNKTFATWQGRLPLGKVPLRSKLFFTKKLGADGSIEKYKARLVVLGNRQRACDYDNISSPIPREASINTFLAVLAAEDLETIHIDWKMAFTSAPIDKDLFVILPKEYGSRMVKLNKQLYGLKQAAYQFHRHVVNNLKDFGIHQLPSEECMFIKYIYPRANSTTSPKQGGCTEDSEWFGDVDDRDIDEHGRLLSNNTDIFGKRIPHKILAILWVDDFVIAYTTGNKDVDKLVAHLKKHFTITVDAFTWFLKCEIIRDRSNRTLYLSQARFAEDCVQSIMGVPFSEVKKTNHTPFVEGYMPNILGCSKSSADVEFMSTRTERFRSHVAKLLWLTRTRQELRFAVSALCRFMGNAGPTHWSDLRKVARYLAGSINKGLKFQAQPRPLHAYSDADWGADVSTRRSVSGWWVSFLGCSIHSASKQQRLVAMSSFESELIAAREAACTLVWARRLIGELGYSMSVPAILWIDNQAVLTVEDSTMAGWRCRAIPLRYFSIKSFCEDGLITLKYVVTYENVADIFTKQVSRTLWDVHSERIVSQLPQ